VLVVRVRAAVSANATKDQIFGVVGGVGKELTAGPSGQLGRLCAEHWSQSIVTAGRDRPVRAAASARRSGIAAPGWVLLDGSPQSLWRCREEFAP
jgi:hypothetical protein